MSARDLFPEADDQFARYEATVSFRNLVVGGVPSDRSVIEKWIASRLEIGDEQLDELIEQTRASREDKNFASTAEAIDAVMSSDLAPSVNGFVRNSDGQLCLEGRTIKAGLKEWANSAYPGTEFPGKTGIAKGFRKGLMSTLVERVFVPTSLVPLQVRDLGNMEKLVGVFDRDVAAEKSAGAVAWVEERIKHVMTPQGPRSSINRVEVIKNATVIFPVICRDDFLERKVWGRIWQAGEEIGLGSDRGRSDGQFDLTSWEKVG